MEEWKCGDGTADFAGTECGPVDHIEPLTTVPSAEASGYSVASWCARSFYESDTSSIPDNAEITSTVFRFEVHKAVPDGDYGYYYYEDGSSSPSSSSALSCNFMPIAARPSTVANPQAAWNDIGDGVPYVSNDPTCASVGTDKAVTLGPFANADLQDRLGSDGEDWFAVGIKLHDEPGVSFDRVMRLKGRDYSPSASPKPTLDITYVVPR